ncbi:hypothetical protein GTY86_08770 [Streptomyces sp. SID5770]|uniref:hypothetical protein n=1 Tax=Streptomyces sp. SID5770 TaxID=2690308 RepID=UPI001370C0A9|nr:hypothetical protein [Streptomyces sp. SID5770]MZE51403.1 hypothetical protein [Streptomyces sp. SID5770]
MNHPLLDLTALSPAWDLEVLQVVRSCAAPLYAVAYPTGRDGWQVSLLERPDAAVRDRFQASGTWPRAVDQQLTDRGYVALASLLCMTWTPLPRDGRGSEVFRDHHDGDTESW